MSQNSPGGRKPRATDEDILSVLRSTDDPVLSTSEIADRLPIKRRSTLDRLRSLEEQSLVESKQIGGRNTVWWLPESVDSDSGIPDDDPFFAEGALFASENPSDEEDIDDIVYGEVEG